MPITIAALSIAVLSLSALLCCQLPVYWPFWKCLGAPYIYVTFHDHHLLKFSRNGCLLDKGLLTGAYTSLREPRGIKIAPHHGMEALFVAEAKEKMSKVLVYGNCDNQGKRSYHGVVSSNARNKGVSHTYGLAIDKHGDIYSSFQHTDVVLRFHSKTYDPLPLPPALAGSKKEYYNGTFYQYGDVGAHHPKQQGIRDIEFVGDHLWIANENLNEVTVVNYKGKAVHHLSVRKPIGMHYDRASDLMFVSSKSSYGAVYAYNHTTYKVAKRYYTQGMTHPTGMTSYDGMLFVGEQDLKSILTFDIASTKFKGAIVEGLTDYVEQLVLSRC